MKLLKILLLILAVFLISCEGDVPLNIDPNSDLTLADLNFGSTETLEVMTWNLENFAKAGSVTVDYLNTIIQNLDVDIICLQEIESATYFQSLLSALPQYEGFRANSAYLDIDLAILYKNSPDFELIAIEELFTGNSWAFPRSPLQITFTWHNQTFYIINNHLKALSGSENEERRKAACDLLADYVSISLPYENVIIVGDLNDLLTDPPSSNVFQSFLDQPQNFYFTDYYIAIGPSENWSWGNGTSHLDHIIITNDLFDEFSAAHTEITTLRIDDYLPNGWSQFESCLSDHLPVALRLPLGSRSIKCTAGLPASGALSTTHDSRLTTHD
ncbi:MAG: endonuclease/exonuclease/phosphatase family protein [Candidatus Cloacimonetes bacterium]|nr:endonuclease/exonuclease/phosphatase family protein [Candidatus Cloacimonadota bacterium]